jgi:hypothetical protein
VVVVVTVLLFDRVSKLSLMSNSFNFASGPLFFSFLPPLL